MPRRRGDVVALLDADDVFTPDKLARVVACCRQRAGAGLVLHAMDVMDSHGRTLYRRPAAGAHEQGWLAERVRARGGRWRSMPASALAFRRGLAERLFPIPEAAFRSEADGYLALLAVLLTEAAYLPEALARYRLHGANLTGTLHLNEAVMTRSLDALRRKNEAVNARLAELGVAGPHLALEDNLNFHEQAFMQALFTGVPRRELLKAYRPLRRALLADDLYGSLRKAGGLAAFGTAIVLPVAARTPWLNRILGARGLRRVLRR